ncbi:MAG: undecaprenyl/decaprenyl-phosphate alpha-N-acetylglucosaminyl 1-phosphate transferase [Chlorobium phaeobacteroides]|uniref:Glycosyl transferase family 4 n=1 Tax=Chlorobium phaeobacteroides (strain BS1) TaxID=331678 RepID=B3EME6_CHLPB|nr:undecaprenyl/decaprenyl-phosphate alpha-N-acetylglucosaminyl 1-phosphate transferase [Chlorobium phaeobacteroides]MBL6956612.1 undecaprenyl/decaprenyl-phosphate alpha-N-acetylglucosaminyl 1-phosphate transferase [Chlorobium phaeobacteroides]
MTPLYFAPIPLFALVSWSTLFAGTTADEAAISLPFAQYTGVYLVALAVSYVMIMFLASHAEKLGFIDHPDGKRKIHTVAKPLVGGIGIITGVLITMLLFMPFWQNLGLIVAMLMILAIGAIDDRHDVSFKIRFLVQTGATASIMYFGGTVLHSFGNLFGFGVIETGMIAWPITLFCVIGVINAVNMTDGLDGLAGGTSLVAFSAFGMLAWLNNQPELTAISIAFVGALAAFLRFNWHPSKLFMGDAGSMSLGFVLAFFAIEVTQKTGTVVSPAAALLVLALPITDTITVMVKRVLKGQSPFHPDKTHLHHVIKAMGFNHRKVVVLIIGLTTVSSSIAVVGTLMNIPDYFFFVTYLFCFTVYFVASYKLRTIYRYLIILRQQKVFNIDLGKVLR